jgi:hypothetical protein
MGDRSRTIPRSGLRFLLRLLSVVAALFVLSLSERAAAAMLAVPMCGEHGESIAAPPIFRAYQLGSIVAAPCQLDELELGQPLPPTPERLVMQQRPERALVAATFGLTETTSSRSSIVSAERVPALPGFVDSLFRPPRV